MPHVFAGSAQRILSEIVGVSLLWVNRRNRFSAARRIKRRRDIYRLLKERAMRIDAARQY
jgi:hypothetical protein